MASALEFSDVMVENEGDYIVIYADISGYSSASNISAVIYYAFEQDIGPEGTSNSTPMKYNPENGLWEGKIQKKYDASTLHYVINITDSGAHNLTDMYAEYGPAEYTYSSPFKFQYTPCLVGAVIVFAAFEIIMHYGRIRERFPEKENDKNNDEDGEKQDSK